MITAVLPRAVATKQVAPTPARAHEREAVDSVWCRYEAYRTCVQNLLAAHKEVLRELHGPTFRAVHEFLGATPRRGFLSVAVVHGALHEVERRALSRALTEALTKASSGESGGATRVVRISVKELRAAETVAQAIVRGLVEGGGCGGPDGEAAAEGLAAATESLPFDALQWALRQWPDMSAIIVFDDCNSMSSAAVEQLISRLATLEGGHRLRLCFAVASAIGFPFALSGSADAAVFPQHFFPPSPVAVMDALFEKLLVEQRLPLMLAPSVLSWMSQQFLAEHCSTRTLLRYLDLALLLHFQKPFSFATTLTSAKVRDRLELLSVLEQMKPQQLHAALKSLAPLRREAITAPAIKAWLARQCAARDLLAALIACCAPAAAALGVRDKITHPRTLLEALLRRSRRYEAFVERMYNALDSPRRAAACLAPVERALRARRCEPGLADAAERLVLAGLAHGARPISNEGVAPEEGGPAAAPEAPASAAGALVLEARCLLKELFVDRAAQIGSGELSELFWFDDAKALQRAFSARPRQAVAAALEEPERFLQAPEGADGAFPGAADAGVLWQAVQEAGKGAPMQELYEDFGAVLFERTPRPPPEEIRARFLAAFRELEVAGLVRGRRGRAQRALYSFL